MVSKISLWSMAHLRIRAAAPAPRFSFGLGQSDFKRDSVVHNPERDSFGLETYSPVLQAKPADIALTHPVDRIRVAIISVAQSYGIDRRVLLGIMMEESHGGVGVVTTYDADGVPTGGLFQASNCHGYDGQNNLAQVIRTTLLCPPPPSWYRTPHIYRQYQ